MAIEVNGLGNGQLSPEKEQEIANRILKRAELAQMTRQLKMKLSKVPTPRVNGYTKEGSPIKSRRKRIDDASDLEIKETAHEVSPQKKKNWNELKEGGGQEELADDTRSPVKPLKRMSTPPPAPPASSSSIREAGGSQEEVTDIQEIPRTPGRVRGHQPIPPVIISTTSNEQDRSKSVTIVTTPKRRLSNSSSARKSDHDNDVGADLLMYLATSPYTSGSSGNQQAKMPTTPTAYTSHGVGHEDAEEAIRFSHMKPSMASPQSTFKVPMHVVSHSYSQGHSQNQLHGHLISSSSQVLLDSPSLYMASSPSPQKRRHMGLQENSNSLLPTTPSRELRSSHLLKTPNFNMGDYVHTLFSPSPRVTTAASASAGRTNSHDLPNGKS